MRFTFYKKHIPSLMMKLCGKMNEEVTFSSPMGQTIVEGSAY